MSYSDQTHSRNPASIAAVIGVHVAIGYALWSGLAYTIITQPPLITVGQILQDPPPPPPHDMPQAKAKPRTSPRFDLVQPPIDPVRREEVLVPTFPDAAPPTGGTEPSMEAQPPTQPRPDLSRRLAPAADRGRWITSADYPSAELRAGITGTVTIATLIGPDGRVQSCEVIKSSGSRGLDDATCRLYVRRAHFAPALDADGHPIAARGTDRFRWEIPE